VPRKPRAIDWSKLRHAYGKATDVPAILADLAGNAQARRKAAAQLQGALVHQGTHYSASAPAVPAVLAALGGPATDRLLELCAALAVGDTTLWLARGFDAERSYKWLAQAHRAVVAGADAIVRLLGDRAAGVRARAAWVLGLLPEVDATPLRARLAEERDEAVRASLTIALGLHGVTAEVTGTPLARAAAAIASAYAGPLTPLLEDALGEAARLPAAEGVPWNGGDLAGIARAILADRVTDRPERALMLLVEQAAASPERDQLLDQARELALGEAPPCLAAELPAPARAFLEAAAELPAFTTQLAPYTLDFDGDRRSDLRRYLGRDAAGPYETVVTAGRTWPIWRWLMGLGLGDVKAAELAAALGAADPATAVAAAVATARYPHGLEIRAYPAQAALLEALLAGLARHGKTAREPLEQAGKRLLDGGPRHHDATLVVCALTRLGPLDPRWDALLPHPMKQGVGTPAALLREVLAALPEPRREALILACAPWSGTELGGGWRYYDLCLTPPVLRALIAHVATWSRAKDKARDARAVELLRAGAARVRPELEAAAKGKAPRRDVFTAALA
jgi:hypothetical protein